jgi:hypothetical protein
MFLDPTVLVLGAGASIPYGYPSANDLRKKMLSPTSNQDSVREFDRAGIGRTFLANFCETFHKSKRSSIDQFLSITPNPMYKKIGKLLIAEQLLECESEERLFGSSADWYEVLLNRIAPTKEDIIDPCLAI